MSRYTIVASEGIYQVFHSIVDYAIEELGGGRIDYFANSKNF